MSEAVKKPGALSKFLRHREVEALAILVALFFLVGLRNPAFTTTSNALFILEDTAIMIILALGMLCVLLVGSIDISVAAIMAVSTMTAGIVMEAEPADHRDPGPGKWRQLPGHPAGEHPPDPADCHRHGGWAPCAGRSTAR